MCVNWYFTRFTIMFSVGRKFCFKYFLYDCFNVCLRCGYMLVIFFVKFVNVMLYSLL